MVQKVADSEMKRRQQAVLAQMKKDGVEALIMYKFGDRFGATLRYLTDLVGGYPPTAIMSAEGIGIFRMGWASETEYPELKNVGDKLPEGTWLYPGLPNTPFTQDAVPGAMVKYIKKYGFKKIGWNGLQFIPASIYNYLTANLPGVEFVDYTNPVDAIRRVKSPYEIDRWMKSVELHDRLVMAMPAIIQPGMTPNQLNLITRDIAARLGAIEFNTALISFCRGDKFYREPDMPFQVGDYIFQLIEVAGAGGEWGECARIFALGEEPNARWTQVAKNLVTMQDAIAAECKPGGIPQEIFRMSNKMLKEFGYPEERRIHSHGQTYDIVDLPMFIDGDLVPLQENEFITIHPGAVAPPFFFNHTDNFLTAKGGAKLLNKTPREIIYVPVY